MVPGVPVVPVAPGLPVVSVAMTPSLPVVLAALVSGGLAAAVLLLVAGMRGTIPDPGRPPGRLASGLSGLTAALRSPALTGRLAGGLAAALVTMVFTRWPVAAAGLGALVVFWPQLFGGTRAEQAQIDRLEALVIWTEGLRDTTDAHASLEQAIPATASNAPPAIRQPLVRLMGQIRARVPMDTALLGLAAQFDDASADLIIAALILNIRRRGDGLSRVLGGLAASAREELDMRRRVSAGRAGLRRGVQIVVVITVAFAMFLVVFSGDFVKPYGTPAGQVALAVVVGIFALGFAWMRKLSGAAPTMAFLARPGQPVDPEDLRLVAGLTGLSPAAAEAIAAQPQTAARR
jgi:tight adherence protein B